MEQKDIEKLDFNRMIRICTEEKLLDGDLLGDLDVVRKMRNRLHIGGLTSVIKTYSQKNMDFALSVVKDIVRAIQ